MYRIPKLMDIWKFILTFHPFQPYFIELERQLREKFELISSILAKSQYNEKRQSVTNKILWNCVRTSEKINISPYCELNLLIGLWLVRTPIKLFSYFWCFPFKLFVCHFVVVPFAVQILHHRFHPACVYLLFIHHNSLIYLF